MSYEKPLSPQQHSEIAQYLHRMEDMPEGGSFTLSGFGQDIARIRFLIYKHLFHSGLKPFYRISYETPTRIRIFRRTTPKITLREDPSEATVANFVCKELFSINSDEEALARIRKAITSGSLDPTLAIQAYEDWRSKIKTKEANAFDPSAVASGPIETFVMDNLFEIRFLEEAEAITSKAIAAGTLDPSLETAVLEEWKCKILCQ